MENTQIIDTKNQNQKSPNKIRSSVILSSYMYSRNDLCSFLLIRVPIEIRSPKILLLCYPLFEFLKIVHVFDEIKIRWLVVDLSTPKRHLPTCPFFDYHHDNFGPEARPRPMPKSISLPGPKEIALEIVVSHWVAPFCLTPLCFASIVHSVRGKSKSEKKYVKENCRLPPGGLFLPHPFTFCIIASIVHST